MGEGRGEERGEERGEGGGERRWGGQVREREGRVRRGKTKTNIHDG